MTNRNPSHVTVAMLYNANKWELVQMVKRLARDKTPDEVLDVYVEVKRISDEKKRLAKR